MKNEELAKIVEAVWLDKEKNFETLFNEISETIYYLSLRILNNPHEAEDATQEAIFYIYTHIEEVKVALAFNQWMNRVVIGICDRFINKSVNKKETLSVSVSYVEPKHDEREYAKPEQYVELKERKEFLLGIIDQ